MSKTIKTGKRVFNAQSLREVSLKKDGAEVGRLLKEMAEQLMGDAPDLPAFSTIAADWIKNERKRYSAPENLERHLRHLQAIAGLTEADLTPGVARNALLSLLAPEGHLSKATVNKVRGTARIVIRDAQLSGSWTGPNPFDSVPRLKATAFHAPIPTQAEFKAFLRFLRADRQREAKVMAVLGPRPGELKAVTRDDLDTARWIVTWRRSNHRDTTKTGRVRSVPVPEILIPVFKEALKRSTSQWVFPESDGSQQRGDKKLCIPLRAALEKASISAAYRWYDLRHCAATFHREAGCDPLVIKLALGHAARSVTDDIYTHLSENFMRRELNKLTGLWD